MSQVNNSSTSHSNQHLLELKERAHTDKKPGAEKAHAKAPHEHPQAKHGTPTTPANTLTSPTSPFGDD